jgi:hypothetical protein
LDFFSNLIKIIVKKGWDMETSIFIARVLGLCYLTIGLSLLFNRRALEAVVEDFCKNAALVFYGGLFSLVIGIVIILTHNVWSARWTVIVTVIGWLALLKGIWIIAFPDNVAKVIQTYRKNKKMLALHSIVALILGAVLSYFGFCS